jgi:hypothetical protein
MQLDAAALAEIETAIPRGAVTGNRYAYSHIVDLDSERATG